MEQITVGEEKLYKLIKKAVREVFKEIEYMTEEDFQAKEKALKELKDGKATDWEILKRELK